MEPSKQYKKQLFRFLQELNRICVEKPRVIFHGFKRKQLRSTNDLKTMITDIAQGINIQSDDGYLKAIVNSIFDSVSVPDSLSMIKEYRSRKGPCWITKI